MKAGLRDNPVAYLEYCRLLGAGGVQHAVSTMIPEFRKRLDELEMYYEGEARPPATLDGDYSEFESQIKDGEGTRRDLRAHRQPPAAEQLRPPL